MNPKHAKGRFDAVMIHDGQAWQLLSGDGLREASAPVPGPANRLPPTLVELAVRAQCRRVRFLLAGDVHRMEGAIPRGMALAQANAVIRASIAETTGVEADGLLVAGLSLVWGNVRKPFTLAGKFDGDLAEDLHVTLAEAGIGCAGFASLEMALLAVWKNALEGNGALPRDRSGRGETRPSRAASLVIVGMGQSFVVPAPRGTNPGPQTVACGWRHFTADAANWLARFQRAAVGIDKGSPLCILALASRGTPAAESVAATLRTAGYAEASAASADEWLCAAARVALLAQANRTQGVAVPVASPYEPRQRFSPAWLVAVALAILALPTGFRWACEWQTERECRRLAAEATPFRPLEERIKKTKKALAAAEAEHTGEQAAQRARLAARRPLVAFIDVAYYFCKYAGASLTLDAIEQRGDRIEVRGTFSDPEDGVRLNKGMLEYARRKHIEVVNNEFVHAADGDAAFASRFTIALDCAKVGE
ncbi:MAG: hypothetical protein ACI4RD_01200 [Kiritimatiellia bacterium]